MKITKSVVTRLALNFAQNLKTEIGVKKFNEVCRRNSTPEYKSCCASHDFCDANMVMLASFEEVIGRCDLNNDSHIQVMNEAWASARKLYLS